MLRLLILRHAKAESLAPGGSDHDRRLTPEGRDDAARLGTWLARKAMITQRVFVSSARRTQETWAAMCAEWAPACTVTTEPQLFNAPTGSIVDLIHSGDAQNLLIIAHNPGLHEAATLLAGSGSPDLLARLHKGLPTAGLVGLDFTAADWASIAPGTGRLSLMVTPATLASAAE